MFGAYFGLATSYVMGKRTKGIDENNNLECPSYTADLFSMIGTIFLWVFWPSFNAIGLSGDDQHRAVVNTYLSLAASCVCAFATSYLMTSERKFNMAHVQNSTLAGGVAVGACANLMIQPYGAVLIGAVAGTLSVVGFCKVTDYLVQKLLIKDTCGVHNLHGIPSVLGAVCGIILAGAANEETYGNGLYDAYPARASPSLSQNPEYNIVAPGYGRTAGTQTGYQIAAAIATLAISIVGGLVTGLVLTSCPAMSLSPEHYYDDSFSWVMSETSTVNKNKSYNLGNSNIETLSGKHNYIPRYHLGRKTDPNVFGEGLQSGNTN